MTINRSRPESGECAEIQEELADLDACECRSPERQREIDGHVESCSACALVARTYQRLDMLMNLVVQDPPFELVKDLAAEVMPQVEVFEAVEDPLDAALREMYELELPPTPPLSPDAEEWLKSIGEGSDYHDRTPQGGDLRGRGSAARLGRDDARPLVGLWGGERSPEQQEQSHSHTKVRQAVISRPLVPTACYVDSPECGERMERVSGPEACLRAVIDLLLQALSIDTPAGGVITLTWLLDSDAFECAPTLLQDWVLALRKLLDQGWKVQHLVRLTPGEYKAVRIVEHLRHFLGAKGLYEPLLLPMDSEWRAPGDDGDRNGPYEFVVVPGLGGLRLGAGDQRYVTNCQFLPPDDALDALRSRLMDGGHQARRLFREVYLSPSTQYQTAISNLEKYAAPRYAVINGFAESLTPSSVDSECAQALEARGGDSAEIQFILARKQARKQAMRENLLAFDHYDACPKSAIERLVKYGIYQTADTWTALGAARLTPEQVREVLSSVIDLVESNPHYHLLLVDEGGEDLCQTEFLAKAGYRAMVEFWLTDAEGHRTRADLEITEPSIVEALHDPQYWEEIKTHALVKRKDVAAYLREQLARI